jgi:hypothetical protein
MKLAKLIAYLTRKRIYDWKFKDKARKKATDFTRNRKLPFEELMLFMLQSLKSSTQCALRRFFAGLGKPVAMKQQSLSEARSKLTVWAFWDLFRLTAQAMADNRAEKWHGYRVCAIDGVKICLPSDKELLEYYGALGKDATAPTAQGSAMYDVLNDIVLDALIEPLKVDERTLAKKHLESWENLAPEDKKLIIFDRNYPSFELIEELENKGLFYVMRARTKFNSDIDAQTSESGYVWLKQGDKRLHVRVIKFALDSGEIETLITNVTDPRLGKNAFKKLYFMRWPVETKYDIVKNKLQLENFNTRTVEGIQQDFFAAMYLANFAAACAADVQCDIEEARKDKDNKYQYKANLNELIGVLKDRLVFAIAEDRANRQSALLQSILDEVKAYVVPVRPGRSTPRKLPRKSKFHHKKQAYLCRNCDKSFV